MARLTTLTASLLSLAIRRCEVETYARLAAVCGGEGARAVEMCRTMRERTHRDMQQGRVVQTSRPATQAARWSMRTRHDGHTATSLVDVDRSSWRGRDRRYRDDPALIRRRHRGRFDTFVRAHFSENLVAPVST